MLCLYPLICFLRWSDSTQQQVLGETRHSWSNQWCDGQKDTYFFFPHLKGGDQQTHCYRKQAGNWDGCQWRSHCIHMTTSHGSFLSFQASTLLANALKIKTHKEPSHAICLSLTLAVEVNKCWDCAPFSVPSCHFLPAKPCSIRHRANVHA